MKTRRIADEIEEFDQRMLSTRFEPQASGKHVRANPDRRRGVQLEISPIATSEGLWGFPKDRYRPQLATADDAASLFFQPEQRGSSALTLQQS